MPDPQYRIDDIVTGVQTLTLKPGDIVAIMVQGRITPMSRERIMHDLRAILPDSVKVIVLEEGATLARVTMEEAHVS